MTFSVPALFSSTKRKFTGLQELFHLPASGEYDKWWRRFVVDRVRLAAIVGLVILAGLAAINLLIVVPALNATGDADHFVSRDRVQLYLYQLAAQELGLLLCLSLTQIPRVRCHPALLLLGCSWSVLLLPQIQSILQGEVELDSNGWIIGFMAQAILIPVQWHLHLISQLTVLGCFAIATLLGLRDPVVPVALTSATYAVVGFYTLCVCIIADLGVFLYERLLRQELALRQQLRLFLHAVSHDLRNPVLGNMMVLKYLENSCGEPARVPHEILRRMIDSGDRQIQLINLLLEAHTAEASGLTLNCKPISLHQITQSVLDDLEPFIQQHQAIVDLNISPEFPLIQVDTLQVRRVYENLIANLLQHNSLGVHLTLQAEIQVVKPRDRWQECRWVRCLVSDDGEGMTPEQCDKLFDFYSRGPSARQTLGVGLGFYICQQIVEAHGGAIGAFSTPRNGTTIWFTLPLEP